MSSAKDLLPPKQSTIDTHICGTHPSRLQDCSILPCRSFVRELARIGLSPQGESITIRLPAVASSQRIVIFTREVAIEPDIDPPEICIRGESDIIFKDGLADSVNIPPELLDFAMIPRQEKGVIIANAGLKFAFNVLSLASWQSFMLRYGPVYYNYMLDLDDKAARELVEQDIEFWKSQPPFSGG
jgi:hypothetical protein